MVFSRTKIQTPFGQWWWTVDRYLLAAIGIIILVGMTLVMAASPTIAEKNELSSYFFIARHFLFLISGLCLMFLFSYLSPVMLRRLSFLGFLGCLFLLVLVQLIGPDIKGAQRWLYIGGFSIQPSEFVKPFFAVVTAWFLSRKIVSQNFPGYSVAIALYLLVVALIVTQPDFGMTLAISAVWGGQLFLAGLSLGWVIGILAAGVVGVVSAYHFLPHVAQRINTFFDPQTGDNYQSDKALEAIINGGFLGRGPGQGVVKEIIPDAHTDFIFAVAGEEFGLLPTLIVVAIFAFVVVRGFYRIYNERDVFVVLATSGLLIQFAIQAIINMGVALSLLPNTGMTLPFVSYGGSSTWAVSIAMGMVLAFTRKRFGNG